MHTTYIDENRWAINDANAMTEYFLTSRCTDVDELPLTRVSVIFDLASRSRGLSIAPDIHSRVSITERKARLITLARALIAIVRYFTRRLLHFVIATLDGYKSWRTHPMNKNSSENFWRLFLSRLNVHIRWQ